MRSRMRGTAVKKCGRTSGRMTGMSSSLSTNHTGVPADRYTYTTMRSKIWLSGRKLTAITSGPTGTIASTDLTLLTIFAWVSMTPLGWPVVPDVYSRVASSSGPMLSRKYRIFCLSCSSGVFSRASQGTAFPAVPEASEKILAGVLGTALIFARVSSSLTKHAFISESRMMCSISSGRELR